MFTFLSVRVKLGTFIRTHARLSSTAPAISLRPYQEHCLEACIDALKAGSTRIGVSLPTGSGKTTVFISLLSRLSAPSENPNATKSLIVVNTIELARQSASQINNLFPDWSVEIEQGSKYKASGTSDVTVATYQTLIRGDRLSKFDPTTLKAVIIDEAHHAAAPSYRKLLAHFDPAIPHPSKTFIPPRLPHKIPIIGFSATFGRHDGLSLGSVFERIVYHRDFLEMIKEQWLCDVRFTSVNADIDLGKVVINGRNGDFNPTSLAHVINTETMNHLVVKTWMHRAETRKSTLVFCVNVEHTRMLTQVFRQYGIDARYVYADTPPMERKALVDAFKAGEFPVLINCAILTEGADIPNIDCVVLARPTRSRNVFAQMIGRGMRLSPNTGKTDCRIIDFVDTNSRVSGVISLPTLFGLEPSEIEVEGNTCSALKKRAQKAIEGDNSELKPRVDLDLPQSVEYTDVEDPFYIAPADDKPRHIATLSSYAWVSCGFHRYVLPIPGRGFIRVELDESQEFFVGTFTSTRRSDEPEIEMINGQIVAEKRTVRPQFMPARRILSAERLSEAIRGSDTYVETKLFHGRSPTSILRTAKWRSAPATEAQKSFLYKRITRREPDLTDEERKAKVQNITKGDAATIITRLQHGTQVRFKRKLRQAAKVLALKEKEQARIAREVVKVGRLSV
ncbi:hypothetical protein CVT24_000522 [Panaeolus cyanescens]|uniref:P-loop containing nucleoside triphosphate hydrolase protein n=1 Tax=Panaeolus cyanescens TaxID=181874 RepID=A0A409V8G3_9AGAR|nr:hypothetical protein CVT24_000522 [Panaeolus cyanescens]